MCFQKDNDRVGPTMLSNFTAVLEAFAAPGKVVVPEAKALKTPFGELEIMRPELEVGKTLFIVFLASEKFRSPMMRSLNSWPQFQVSECYTNIHTSVLRLCRSIVLLCSSLMIPRKSS